jgi:hypothetical protein
VVSRFFELLYSLKVRYERENNLLDPFEKEII